MNNPSKRSTFNIPSLENVFSYDTIKRSTDEIKTWTCPLDEVEYPLTFAFIVCGGLWMNYCARQIVGEYPVTFPGTQYDQFAMAKFLSVVGILLILAGIGGTFVYLKYISGFRSKLYQGLRPDISKAMMMYFTLWAAVILCSIVVDRTLTSGATSTVNDLYRGIGKARTLYQMRLRSERNFGFLYLKYKSDKTIHELDLLIHGDAKRDLKIGLNISCRGHRGNTWTFFSSWPKNHTELIPGSRDNTTVVKRSFMDDLPFGACNITACTPCVLKEEILASATNSTDVHASTCFLFVSQHKTMLLLHAVRSEILFVFLVTIISMVLTIAGTVMSVTSNY